MNQQATRRNALPLVGWIAALALLLPWIGNAEGRRYIVTFANSQSYSLQSQKFKQSKYLAELGLAERAGSSEGLRLLGTNAAVERSLDQLEMMIVKTDSVADLTQLRQHPAIADIEEEVIYPLPQPMSEGQATLPMAGKGRRASNGEIDIPWGIKAVKADEAWAVTKGDGARVGILDTGIDKDHPDLASRFEKGRDFSSSGGFSDDVGHGTHVAGTIAADGEHSGLVGVAPKAKLLAGKVCSANGCSSAAIVSGIDWAVGERVDVISMSLGGPIGTPAQQRAVERAEQAGVVVVAASGNDGTRRISYPAAFPSVIAVGAVAQTPNGLKRADFSQYGQGLDIVAPGVDVLSSVPQGAGRLTSVTILSGDKTSRVKSSGLQGAAQNEQPVTGDLVFAGLGKPEDIRAVNLRGKMALIQRGEITFSDKVKNALNAGAIGVLIYNNADGLARGGLGDNSVNIPVAMIERSVGEQIKADLSNKTVKGTIQTEASDYDSYDGTSMATPHVSGVVALVRAANRNLSPAQVRDVLSRTATNMGPADEYGAGLVNANAAVRSARTTRTLDLASGM